MKDGWTTWLLPRRTRPSWTTRRRLGVTASTRDALMRTWAGDSSPETYRTVEFGCALDTDAAVSRRSVDLPIPGSPATSTTEPGTSPPPRTLSNSWNPVGIRCDWWRSTSVTGVGCGLSWDVADARDAPRRRPLEAMAGSWNSVTVPHCPHSGHRPYHLGPLHPHSEQRNCVVVAIASDARRFWRQAHRGTIVVEG